MKQMSVRHSFCLLLLLALGCLVAVVFQRFHFDDPFFAYRYAENLARGEGWTYNPGVSYNASTSAANTLLLAAAAAAGLDIPTASNVLWAVFAIGAASLLYLLLAEGGHWLGATLGGVLLLTNPLLLLTYGKETSLLLLLVTLSLYAERREWRVTLGLSLGMLALARPDGALLALLVLARRVWQRRAPAIPAIGASLTVLPWLVYSWWRFGAPWPGSLTSKMREGAQYGPWSFLLGFPLYWTQYLPTAVALLPLTVFALAGLRIVFRRGGEYRLLLIFVVTYCLAYALIHPPAYMTYYVPVAYLLIVAAAVLVQRLLENRGKTPTALAYAGVTVLVGAQLVTFAHCAYLIGGRHSGIVERRHPFREWDYLFYEFAAYSQVGHWLKAHTPRESLLAMSEAGVIGFYARRSVTDNLGVVTPDALGLSTSEWIRRYRPDFVIFPCDFAFLESIKGSGASYDLLHRFRFDTYLDILVYRRLPAGDSPAASPEDASPIVLEPMADVPGAAEAPVFRWQGQGSFIVDMFFVGMDQTPPFGADLWYSSSEDGPPIRGNRYSPPARVWKQVPVGQRVLWRVRQVSETTPPSTRRLSNMMLLVR